MVYIILAIWAKATVTYDFAHLNTFYPLCSRLPILLPAPSAPQALSLWKQSCILSLDYLRNITYFKNGSVGRT